MDKVQKTDEEWKKELTPEEFEVTRKKGTERAFTGRYWDNHEQGYYQCVCCGNDLFTSDTKFESGTGWPSFWKPVSEADLFAVEYWDLEQAKLKVGVGSKPPLQGKTSFQLANV